MRARAARWRKLASHYDERTAKGLEEAADALEARAAAIEAERGATGPAPPDDDSTIGS